MGQKLLAQGNTLGLWPFTKTPCKGKSFNFECFCAYRAILFLFFLYFIQCLLDVIQDILYILDTY